MADEDYKRKACLPVRQARRRGVGARPPILNAIGSMDDADIREPCPNDSTDVPSD